MKVILYSFLAVVLLAGTARAVEKPRDITTKDNVTYHNATIMGHDTHQAMISCDEGTVFVPLESLPADIQKELGYMGPGAQEKADAEKAAAAKAQAEKEEKDKQAKLESSKHEILPGTEKHAYPELNPDFFPDELASQISAYNTKAQFTNILAGGAHSPDTDATIKANAAKMAALRTIYLNYKKFMESPPADLDAAKARKAVANQDYKPYGGMPDIILESIMGVPDKVESHTSPDNTTTVKSYHYGEHKFDFENGKYIDAANPPPAK